MGNTLAADDICTRILSFVLNRTEEKREILEQGSFGNLKGITFEERRSFDEDPGSILYGKNLAERIFQENMFEKWIF